MYIDSAGLNTVFAAFNAAFLKGKNKAIKLHPQVAMVTKSSAESEEYAWLGALPAYREWIGSRVIKNLTGYGFSIKNKLWETTVSVARTKIEDDQYGLFAPMFEDMGLMA